MNYALIIIDVHDMFICLLQVVTSEGWSELMYLILDVSSKYSWIYFVVLITVSKSSLGIF